MVGPATVAGNGPWNRPAQRSGLAGGGELSHRQAVFFRDGARIGPGR